MLLLLRVFSTVLRQCFDSVSFSIHTVRPTKHPFPASLVLQVPDGHLLIQAGQQVEYLTAGTVMAGRCRVDALSAMAHLLVFLRVFNVPLR